MNSIQLLIGFIAVALQVIAVVFGVYQFGVSLFGFTRRSAQKYQAPKRRFAVLIPAHNEQRVIGSLLANLQKLDYPQELYDVFVIADNCVDDTAAVSRSYGVNVWERQSLTERGKGHAIRWMLKNLGNYSQRFDAIVMFDADNLVSANFLRVMNDHLCKGERVVQGYLDTKNPYDSWVSISMAISYWYTNRMWQLARRTLGLACALGGTGLCIDAALLQQIGWDGDTIAEDTEFGAKCVLAGINPVWSHEARVYDEKPVTIVASLRQRLRWMRGHFSCAEKYIWSLFRDGIKERSLAKVDAALYLFQPASFLLVFAASIFIVIQIGLFGRPDALVTAMNAVPNWVWYAANGAVLVEMLLAMVIDRVNWRGMLGIPLFPIFMLTWVPIIFFALITRHNQRWHHTVHTRAIPFQDMQRPH